MEIGFNLGTRSRGLGRDPFRKGDVPGDTRNAGKTAEIEQHIPQEIHGTVVDLGIACVHHMVVCAGRFQVDPRIYHQRSQSEVAARLIAIAWSVAQAVAHIEIARGHIGYACHHQFGVVVGKSVGVDILAADNKLVDFQRTVGGADFEPFIGSHGNSP